MISKKEIESILLQDKKKQFEYFIKRVADFEEIWIITDSKGIVLLQFENDKLALPVWPFKEYAELFCVQDYQACKIEAISIYEFLEHELAILNNNGYDLVIMPIYQSPSIIVNPEIFESAIRIEMEKYE